MQPGRLLGFGGHGLHAATAPASAASSGRARARGHSHPGEPPKAASPPEFRVTVLLLCKQRVKSEIYPEIIPRRLALQPLQAAASPPCTLLPPRPAPAHRSLATDREASVRLSSVSSSLMAAWISPKLSCSLSLNSSRMVACVRHACRRGWRWPRAPDAQQAACRPSSHGGASQGPPRPNTTAP